MASGGPTTLSRVAARLRRLASAQRRGRGTVDPALAAFLRDVDKAVRERTAPRVAVLVADGPPLDRMLRETFPAAQVQRVPARRASAQHVFLAAHGPYDVLVDAGLPSGSPLRRFERVFPHLAEGGVMVARTTGGGDGPSEARRLVDVLGAAVDAAQGPRPPWRARRRRLSSYGLGRTVGQFEDHGGHAVVTARRPSLAKLREHETNRLIRERGDGPLRVVEERPGAELVSRCTLRENRPGFNPRMTGGYTAPPVSLREYDDAICVPGQVVAQGNLLLPDTYRHHPQEWLYNRYTEDIAPRFARLLEDRGGAGDLPRLPGTWYHLDCELRGHFGHSMTEQVSRLWGWAEAKRRHPDLKALLSVGAGKAGVTGFERQIFATVGIDEADVVAMPGPVVVDRLVAATPMFSMPYYVHPDLVETWRRIGDGLAAHAPERDYPAKFFCSRRSTKRACRNGDLVESWFAEAGFEIVFPEDHTLPEQVRMFREAQAVGGYSGSALFTLALVPTPTRVVMLSSESYTASNEYMIAAALGHSLDVVWCPADIPHPEGGWRNAAFESGYAFDVERDGDYLRGLLAST